MTGLSDEQWPMLRDLGAVCLNNEQCGLSDEAPIFCGERVTSARGATRVTCQPCSRLSRFLARLA